MVVVEFDPVIQLAPGYRPRRIVPPAAAKLRILETANRLFYTEGIRGVGVDRLISESRVTKATFYKHYGSKDRLIVEYVIGRDHAARRFFDTLGESSHSALATLDGYLAAVLDEIRSPSFRGCPFINASIEFGDPGHPVRQAVADHRDWLSATLAGLLGDIGQPLPGDAADDLVLARDGAMAGSYAGDPVAASAAFQRAGERILAGVRT